MNQTLAAWVERGYAVTKTDYQGLGTEGGIGTAEARAAIDMTLAARELATALSERWMVNGHSQGGQAALFTAELGELRAPQLDFRGAVSLVPPSQTRDMLNAARSTPRKKADFYPLLIRGAETETDLRDAGDADGEGVGNSAACGRSVRQAVVRPVFLGRHPEQRGFPRRS